MKKNIERFSERVENYVMYRPKYPKVFIDYLYKHVGFSRDSVIADIGSGTGILTTLLLEMGSRVVGIEPNREMRKAAEAILDESKKFISIDGTAEETGLADGSMDFVIIAQAFHWFDRNACKKEFQRILRPNGKVVLVWNKRKVEETGFSAEYEKLVNTYANDYNEVNHNLITEEVFRLFFKNGVYHKAVFGNQQIFDFEGLKGRLLSSSYSPMPGEQNYDPLLAELKNLFDKFQANGSVTFEYETESYIGEV